MDAPFHQRINSIFLTQEKTALVYNQKKLNRSSRTRGHDFCRKYIVVIFIFLFHFVQHTKTR